MIRMKYLMAGATLILVLAGCSSDSKNIVIDTTLSEIYAAAQQTLQNGNFQEAIIQLESMDNRYPFGPYSQQVQLDLIYAYYKSEELVMAQGVIDRFLRLNPTQPNVDHVLYMSGLINMEQDYNSIQEFFGVDRSDRDPQYARVAFRDFHQLLHAYPYSQFAMDAGKRLVFLRERLAKYEFAVAEYYIQRGAYVAVANRIEQMMRNFPETQAMKKALPLMEKAYRELKLFDQADKVSIISHYNQAK